MCRWFYNGIKVTLWFESWTTRSLNSYLICLVGLVLFAVAHEALATARASFAAKVFATSGVNGDGQPVSQR